MIVKKQRYPIGLQDFAGLRKDGWVYIDKTEIIYDLVNDNKYVFLARPRRFGKSLLLSTIRYYFEGRKDLFEGLKIMDLEKDWKHHPVLHLELSRVNTGKPDSLLSALNEQFHEWEKKYEVEDDGLDYAQRFSRIIKRAYEKTGNRVVILVDEYDNPLINTLDKSDIHEQNRGLLKSIYSNLKALDEYIRFGMLTGVSRFSNLTIFSGLNNINDISLSKKFDEICGFTQEEIETYLWPGVTALGEELSVSAEETLLKLKYHYDGYHFSKSCRDLYNPFSILLALYHEEIKNYWIASGAPNFLIEKLKESKLPFQKIFNDKVRDEKLSESDLAFNSPVALLYQTGYLTIKSYDKETDKYLLGIPNYEVNEGLFSSLLSSLSDCDKDAGLDLMISMSNDLQKGDPEKFLLRLQSFLSSIPYNVWPRREEELNFERLLFVILHGMGRSVKAEQCISNGRIDLLVETSDFLYVIELKLDKSASEALEQIDSKDYSLPWRYDGRKIFKIGVNFSSTKRNIDSWKIEKDD